MKKKALAIALAVALAFSNCPSTIFAADVDPSEQAPVVVEETKVEEPEQNADAVQETPPHKNHFPGGRGSRRKSF